MDLLVATAKYLLANEKMDGKLFEYMCKNNGRLPPPENPVVISAQPQQSADRIMDSIRQEAAEDARIREMREKGIENTENPFRDSESGSSDQNK